MLIDKDLLESISGGLFEATFHNSEYKIKVFSEDIFAESTGFALKITTFHV